MTVSIDTLSPVALLRPPAGPNPALILDQTGQAVDPFHSRQCVGTVRAMTGPRDTGSDRSQDPARPRCQQAASEPSPPVHWQWGAASPLDVVIAERQQMVRAALTALVSQMDGMRVVAHAANASELLDLLETVHPDVVIADLALAGPTGGTAIEEVRERHPQLPVLAVSSDDTRATVQRVAAVGAGGYISRCSTPDELELALRNMAASGGHLPARAVLHLLSGQSDPKEKDPLTPRQRQIAMMFAQGRSAKQIAYELGLSVRTVDVHRARIFHRLHVDGLAELTREALRRGLIDP